MIDGKPAALTRTEALVRAKDPLGVIHLMGVRSEQDKWVTVLKRDPCVYCGRRSPGMTIDHIEARSKGNARTGATNGAPACFSCNQLKAGDSLLMFLARGAPERRAALYDFDGLLVELSPRVRRRAHRRLGHCPPRDWWAVIAKRIVSRSLRATEYRRDGDIEFARWVVPIRSIDGVDMTMTVKARSHWSENEIWKVSFKNMAIIEEQQ